MHTDNEIVKLIKSDSGREKGVRLLISTYKEYIYWHIRKMVFSHDDADDILQNTFIKVWKNIGSFRGDAKLKTWIYRIATNETLTFLNKNKNRLLSQPHSPENSGQYASSYSGYMEGSEIEQKLHQAIALLPDKQRLVFNMKYFEEMKYDDMVEILGGTTGSLKASYHHAVKKVENFLKGN